MAGKHQLIPGPWVPASTNYGVPTGRVGTNANYGPVGFDDHATLDQVIFFEDRIHDYAGGDLTLTIDWYPTSGTTQVARWFAALMAFTPETDSQDYETRAFAAATSVNDTHLGTTARRLMRTTITITGASKDSIANEDDYVLKFGRECSNAADTFTGIRLLVPQLWLTWA